MNNLTPSELVVLFDSARVMAAPRRIFWERFGWIAADQSINNVQIICQKGTGDFPTIFMTKIIGLMSKCGFSKEKSSTYKKTLHLEIS